MNHTTIKVYLSIFGDIFDPVALTQLIGIEPTSTGIKGQPTNSKRTINKETFWDLSTESIESLFLEEVNNSLLDKISGLESIIFQFMTKHNLSAKFNIVVKIIDQQSPSLYFNRAFLNCVESLAAEVDIDTYVL
jgi:Domain of unknown function (DUF4279)